MYLIRQNQTETNSEAFQADNHSINVYTFILESYKTVSQIETNLQPQLYKKRSYRLSSEFQSPNMFITGQTVYGGTSGCGL